MANKWYFYNGLDIVMVDEKCFEYLSFKIQSVTFQKVPI